MEEKKKLKKAYFIGIKGSGMAALAEIYQSRGFRVIGSDTEEKFFTDTVLDKLKIKYYEKFSPRNIEKELPVDEVVYSTAYNFENNAELAWAKEKSLPLVSYPEALGFLSKQFLTLAVCGTHGKTTTSAMLAMALKDDGAEPSAIIGGKVLQWGSNALIGKGKFLILEADEYQKKLLFYHPWAVVLTSADFDHPDTFSDFEEYKNVFKKFAKKIPPHGFLVAWAGSRSVLEIAFEANCKIIFYGDSRRQVNSAQEEFLRLGKKNVSGCVWPEEVDLSVPGKHNRINATAVLAVGEQLKLDQKKLLASLKNYQGTSRRFELLGKYKGADIIDDYAHHPEEIKATLRAAWEKYPFKNRICVFHPHTFTRTKALLDDFSQSFADANEVLILDIYGSAREKQGGIHSRDLVAAISRYHRQTEYVPDIPAALALLKEKLTAKDVLIVMGAGDVNKLGEELVALD